MKTSEYLPGRIALLTVILSSAVSAQTPAHAADGGSYEHLQSVTIPPKPGAPFSATVITTWTRLLEDGTRTTIKNHRIVARDSTGRIFQERRYFSANGDKEVTPLSALEYSDPNRHELSICLQATHICTVYQRDWPASTPMSLAPSTILPNSAGTITREDLGEKNMDNLQVLGSREVTTLNPASWNGYKNAEPTIKEFWYSPHLEVNLVINRFEPRGGVQNFALHQISLNEPSPYFFAIPADFKIVHASQ